jgi:sugar fermentation stimulation protein A
MCFLVQRGDVTAFSPADAIDPAYGEGLRDALAHGVEVLVLQVDVRPSHLSVTGTLPVVFE